MVSFTLTMRRHVIWLASAPITSFRLAKFCLVPSADLRVQRLATKQNAQLRRVCEKYGPILSRLYTKVHEILGQRKRSFVLSKSLFDCLCHVSFRRYSPLSLEVIEKPKKNVKVIWPPIFGRTTIDRLIKFGWDPFADLRLRRLAMKLKTEFTQGGKMQIQF